LPRHGLKKQDLQPFTNSPLVSYTNEGMNEISSFPTRVELSLHQLRDLDDFAVGSKSTRVQDAQQSTLLNRMRRAMSQKKATRRWPALEGVM
jgi:hypothetical protein